MNRDIEAFTKVLKDLANIMCCFCGIGYVKSICLRDWARIASRHRRRTRLTELIRIHLLSLAQYTEEKERAKLSTKLIEV